MSALVVGAGNFPAPTELRFKNIQLHKERKGTDK